MDESYEVPQELRGTMPANGQVIQGASRLNVDFYRHPREDADFVRISAPGDSFTVLDEPATERHKAEHGQAWKVYQGLEEKFRGQTRLEAAPWMDAGILPELQAKNIHTVEQMASLTDEAVSAAGLMGLTKLRALAQRDVEEKRKAEAHSGMAAEIEKLKLQVEQLSARPARAAKA